MEQAIDVNNSNISYGYINYTNKKCIPSIKEYYKHKKVSAKDHISLFYFFCSKTKLKFTKSLYNVKHCHIFWSGISIHQNIISHKWKKKMFEEIDSWKRNGKPPFGIWKDSSKYREKYFINYKYCYRSSNNMSTSEVNKANSIAAGLRNIENAFIPTWIEHLIIYLKDVEFISKTECINQLGINYYYNNTKNKIVYNGIDPHLEYNKFSVVYSVSIYKNPLNPTSLSFNLHSNKSCGDSKILMADCSGMKMHSYEFGMIYLCPIHAYIHIHSSQLVYEFGNTFCIQL